MLTIIETKKEIGLHITTTHSGKMDGMLSLSTSPLKNNQCKKNCAIKNSICSSCYSLKQMKRWPSIEKPLAKNLEILTNEILPLENLPLINALYFRFEAFGDLENDIQVINYFNIAKLNKHTNFTIFTKNPHHIAQAIAKGHEKPKNLIVIRSSLFVNRHLNIEVAQAKYPFIDKIFTVYDESAENVHINCGNKKCLKCLNCYTQNDIVYLRERIK